MTTTGGAVFSTASLAGAGAPMPPLALALDSVREMTACTTAASSSLAVSVMSCFRDWLDAFCSCATGWGAAGGASTTPSLEQRPPIADGRGPPRAFPPNRVRRRAEERNGRARLEPPQEEQSGCREEGQLGGKRARQEAVSLVLERGGRRWRWRHGGCGETRLKPPEQNGHARIRRRGRTAARARERRGDKREARDDEPSRINDGEGSGRWRDSRRAGGATASVRWRWSGGAEVARSGSGAHDGQGGTIRPGRQGMWISLDVPSASHATPRVTCPDVA